jgi:putative endonuclease
MVEISGRSAEFIALQYLRLKGYELVGKNYITGHGTGAGEIDLIVQKNHTIVFVEVKKRKNLETASYAILPQQMQRIRKGAEAFLANHSYFCDYDVRFDAVLIESFFKIKHIENAF